MRALEKRRVQTSNWKMLYPVQPYIQLIICSLKISRIFLLENYQMFDQKRRRLCGIHIKQKRRVFLTLGRNVFFC